MAGNVETEGLYRAHAQGLDASDSEAFAAADAYLSSVWALFRPSYHRIELRDSARALLYVLGEPESLRTDPGMAEPPTYREAVELEFPVTVAPTVLSPDSGSFTYRENDSLRVASFFNVASPPWTVVSSAAVDEFSSPFARMRNVNLAVMLLVAAAIGLSFFLMTRRATLSLEQLTAAADDVARGELSPQIPGGGSDEVGRLSRALGIMVEEVRKMLGRVEETRHMAVMGEFASRVSHEIRTPLTSIKLNLQELGRDADQGKIPDDSAPPVRICLREVERLDRAVSSVLSMVPTHPPNREPCSLHSILTDATEAVGPQLKQENVHVEHRFQASRHRVLGDSRDLEGVFVNLLVNAGQRWACAAAHGDPGV